MVNNLIARLGLTILESIRGGHRCKYVYRVRDASNKQFVLKISDNAEGSEEIRRNLRGYEKLKSAGLNFFIPEVVSSDVGNTYSYILMEDCGHDLASQFQRGEIGLEVYERITSTMLQVYTESLKEGRDAYQHAEFEILTIKTLYQDFFQPRLGSPALDADVNMLEQLLSSLDMNYFCFASWDFMPRNIFLTQNGVKFIDPTEFVTGVPIIDLACLGGALKDVHHFPGAIRGMQHFHEFALGPLASLLSLSSRDAERMYLLGRLVQSMLSLRESCLRKNTVTKFFDQKVQLYLQRLINS